MRTQVDLYHEPLMILGQLSEKKAEMTERELGFLCGLIREYRPKKLVEIGVSAGGTSSVVMNCISLLGLETEIFSIDLEQQYYKDKKKKTGYLIDECKRILNDERMDQRHHLCTGKYAVECLEDIGKGIDLLILDTVHILPGELLDLLACYPFLEQGAVVVLHDIRMSHYRHSGLLDATKVIFDTVTADKILDLEAGAFPNIGAFRISQDTERHIADLFSALTMNWGYAPESDMLTMYKSFYSRYHTEPCLELFDMAVKMNCETLKGVAAAKRMVIKDLMMLHAAIQGAESVYIYGNGQIARALHRSMTEDLGAENICHIVSDGQYIDDDTCDHKVYHLSDVRSDLEAGIVIIGVGRYLQDEVRTELEKCGVKKYIALKDHTLRFLQIIK